MPTQVKERCQECAQIHIYLNKSPSFLSIFSNSLSTPSATDLSPKTFKLCPCPNTKKIRHNGVRSLKSLCRQRQQKSALLEALA
jgi:hypothetical protein